MAERTRAIRHPTVRAPARPRSVPVPARRPLAGSTAAPTLAAAGPDQILDLQRGAGNRAVLELVGGTLQRTPITQATAGETLYNQTRAVNPAVPEGVAGAKFYGGRPVTYDMTRSETEVVVSVRIKFVSQDRDTARTLPDGTDNPNYLGHIGSPAAIPEGDDRIEWARRICREAPILWNGRVRFRGREEPEGPAGGGEGADAGVPLPAGVPEPAREVVLPVRFQAEPTFDLNAEADKTVRLYGSAVTPGQAAGHPIDAGNYYTNLGTYGPSEQAIYAHEYGHLIGLADEYSQSNFQMHALLHRVSPEQGASRSATLDRASVERMVLAALTRPLFFQLSAAGAELAAVFARNQSAVVASLSDGIRDAAVESAVTEAATGRLTPITAPRLQPRVPGVVGFQAGHNLGSRTIARGATSTEFAAGPLGSLIADQYFAALQAPHGERVDVGGGPSGRMSITIQGSAGGAGSGIWAAGESAALAPSSGGVASSVVGETATGRIPPVRPSSSLISQIRAIPTTWAGSTAAIGATLAPASLAAAMAAAMRAARAAAAAAPAAPAGGAPAGGAGAAPAAEIRTVRNLYVRARDLVHGAARSAARSELRRFVRGEIEPVLRANVQGLQADIAADVARVMATPAETAAADAPPDPALRAIVSGMKTRLEAATPAGQDPTDPSAGAANPASPANNPTAAAVANQEVTYSNEGMMSDNTGDVRPDQLQAMLGQFNDTFPALRHANETQFTVERAS